jgi:uncharacterized protein with WD repeat
VWSLLAAQKTVYFYRKIIRLSVYSSAVSDEGMFSLFPKHSFSCSVSYFPRFISSNKESLVKANACETLQLHLLKIQNVRVYQFSGHENYEMILAVWFDEASCTNSLLMRKQLATTQTVMIWG